MYVERNLLISVKSIPQFRTSCSYNDYVKSLFFVNKDSFIWILYSRSMYRMYERCDRRCVRVRAPLWLYIARKVAVFQFQTMTDSIDTPCVRKQHYQISSNFVYRMTNFAYNTWLYNRIKVICFMKCYDKNLNRSCFSICINYKGWSFFRVALFIAKHMAMWTCIRDTLDAFMVSQNVLWYIIKDEQQHCPTFVVTIPSRKYQVDGAWRKYSFSSIIKWHYIFV